MPMVMSLTSNMLLEIVSSQHILHTSGICVLYILPMKIKIPSKNQSSTQYGGCLEEIVTFINKLCLCEPIIYWWRGSIHNEKLDICTDETVINISISSKVTDWKLDLTSTFRLSLYNRPTPPPLLLTHIWRHNRQSSKAPYAYIRFENIRLQCQLHVNITYMTWCSQPINHSTV